MSLLLALAALVIALAIGYWVGRGARGAGGSNATVPAPVLPTVTTSLPAAVPPPDPHVRYDGSIAERARVIRSYEGEAARLRGGIAASEAVLSQLSDFAADRRSLFDDLARSRTETARYRQIVVDLENNAPSQLFGPGAPDDLKLIVGIGPVLERMLHQLGITTFRQIAFWSERDIDDIDGKLPEFPGRIRRDDWVTQARSLHQSKFGLPPERP